MSALALFGIVLVLMALRVPIFLAMGIACVVYFWQAQMSLAMLAQRAGLVLDSFPLIAIPLFMLAGRIMNQGGITRRIYAFCHDVVGFVPGGLGHVNILGSLVFAGMSGSALADLGGLGQIEIKAMRDAGYDRKFAAGVTLASSILGPIIPPSIPAVIYAINAEVSVTALFLAGVVPGLVMALLQMLFVGLIASRRGYPRERRPTLQQVGRHLVGALPAMCAPVILIGGMTLGIFSATEAAVVAVVYSVALSFAYRELSLRELLPMSMEVGREVAVLTIIIATAMIFGWILTVERVPQAMADVVLAWATYPGLLLLAIVALIVFLGCFMEGTVLLLLLPPIFVPALVKAGIDPVHFGIVMIIAVGIGLYTPPVGVALYAMQSFTGMSFRDVSQAAIPWLVPMIGALLIVMYWPAAVLVVPRAFGY
jgi:tripartite ATP-independent transporter DctM subunit